MVRQSSPQVVRQNISPTKISERSTKSEILDAYQELLSQLDQNTMDGESSKKIDLKSQASDQTVKKIIDDLSALRITANQTISSLTDKLTVEAERFDTLQKAVALVQSEIEEANNIRVRLGVLKQLIELQKQKEVEFEKHMSIKRTEWEEEQAAYEKARNLRRKREEEEYQYEFNLRKKRDLALLEENKIQFEKEQQDRAESVKKQLEELDVLRKQVGEFETQVEKAVREADAKARNEEKRETTIATSFAKQEADSRQKLFDLKIASLEEIVKNQAQEIIELKRQLEKSTNQVKDIAVSVIENSKKDNLPVTSINPK